MQQLKPIRGRDFYRGDYGDLIFQLDLGGHTTKEERRMMCSVIQAEAARAGYQIKSVHHFVGWLHRAAIEMGR